MFFSHDAASPPDGRVNHGETPDISQAIHGEKGAMPDCCFCMDDWLMARKARGCLPGIYQGAASSSMEASDGNHSISHAETMLKLPRKIMMPTSINRMPERRSTVFRCD